jgi:Xaa-Pro aminopeptidase
MLSDLDPLMEARGICALVVPMHEAMHASFRWLTRGARVTRGYAVKVAGQEVLLVTYPMEREEAAVTGLSTKIVHQQLTDPAAYAAFFDELLREQGARPRIAFLGNAPLHLYFRIAAEMQRKGWEIAPIDDIIQLARKRKDAREIEAIRSVGERTEQVVDGVRTMLRECEAGRPLRLGDIKHFVSLEIARLGMIEDHETIVSQGRDAGIPHSRGDAAAPVRRGVPLVIDIFPADKTAGYFFDLTRTFCIGDVPDDLRRIHEDVRAAFELAAREMKPGQLAAASQSLVCDFFESEGYPTTRSEPATLHGYVHSLGHGVGLDIHEKPSFSLTPENRDVIEAGDVLTIEPGLYFPEREIGVRIEDTFLVTEDGVASLCRSSSDLRP